jgi:WS/DGAT/MGAT family acyltransferase
MAQAHLDRLTGIDAGFLLQEGPEAHMHVGALMLFEGPAPGYGELADALRERLHLVPRYRQKVAVPPAGGGRPVWVDDAAFDLELHVRHVALPRPAEHATLLSLAARVFSEPLDRRRSLWEIWLVEGLAEGAFALISKTHHAMIDGIAGVDLAQALLDVSPVPAEVPHTGEPWRPAPEPSAAELLARGAVSALRAGVRAAGTAAEALAEPRTTVATAVGAAEALGELARAGARPAPPTPLNVPIGPQRRLVSVHRELDELKAIGAVLGGTVNDVVLAAVTGALREWLRTRRFRTDGLELQALVPVSLRGTRERGALGNRLTAMRGTLPVGVEDPVARLEAVRATMDALKDSKQALGVEIVAALENVLPPAILALASRLQISSRFFNLLVTNVPGPQFPLYLRGRELLDVVPVALLPREHALAVAVVSYHGLITFGLLGDRSAMADLDVLAEGVDRELDALGALAGALSPGP